MVIQSHVCSEVFGCQSRKPKSGATNMEVERFVYEKYIKRKYVTDLNCPDPLTAYKRNNYQF